MIINANAEATSSAEQKSPTSPSKPKALEHPPAYDADGYDTVDHLPPASVDQVHIYDKKGDIVGTFYIDPTTPARSKASLKRRCNKQLDAVPHASFRTRKGKIALDLGATGQRIHSPRANISVRSMSGDIAINLLPGPPTRPLVGLSVESRSGDIITFLPETFTGVVHLRTKKGAITVLPALAGCVRVVKHSDSETLFIVESPRDPAPDTTSESNRETALCELTSRRGNVIIGLRGRDRHEPSVGLWQKLSNFFSG